MKRTLGLTYVGFSAATILFQISVVFGAPLGAFTQGGATEGSLNAAGRTSAGVSIVILALLAFVVASKAGLGTRKLSPMLLGVGFWFVLVINFLEFVLNWITPSQQERMLWGPVNTVLFACVVGIAVMSRRK